MNRSQVRTVSEGTSRANTEKVMRDQQVSWEVRRVDSDRQMCFLYPESGMPSVKDRMEPHTTEDGWYFGGA